MAHEYQKNWEFLKSKFESNQLGHAYLFAGQDAEGITGFAKDLVKYMSRAMPQAERMIDNGVFPDLMVVKSANSKSSRDNEKDMLEIDIGQIRDVNNFLSFTSYYGSYKTVIIEQAERMNTAAQNCLLKILEEPKGKTLIILIAKAPELQLPTVVSRCQIIQFLEGQTFQSSVEQQMLRELLPLFGAELAAKFQYTKRVNLEGENFSNILKGVMHYFRNLMLEKLGVIGEIRDLPHRQAGKGQETSSYPLEKIQNILKLTEKLYIQSLRYNVNSKLALEILLLEI